MDQEITPPPLKRRRKDTTQKNDQNDTSLASGNSKGEEAEETRNIRVFSWNINGVKAFLPASNDRITSFFKPVDQATKKPGPSRVSGGVSGPIHSRSSPLRSFLKRHRWPEVVFLQELQINPSFNAKKTLAALVSSINMPFGEEGHDDDDDTTSSSKTRYTLDANLPRDGLNARSFGGRGLYGVGTLLREDFVQKHVAVVRHAEWDLEGRVTIVELKRPRITTVGVECEETADLTSKGTRTSTSTSSSASASTSTSTRLQPRADTGQPHALALISIYAVNGTHAPYHQCKPAHVRAQEEGGSVPVAEPAATRHDHKRAVHALLRDEALNLEARGFDVVIAGDLNVARGTLDGHPRLRTWPRAHCENRADFNAKFFGREDNARAEAYLGGGGAAPGEACFFDGVDVFRALRGQARRYTYHPRRDGEDWGASCDRVDLVIASRRLLEREGVVDTDILDSPQERGTSDHVPLWVKLRLP